VSSTERKQAIKSINQDIMSKIKHARHHEFKLMKATEDDAQLDEMLDEAYERYVTKKGGEVKQEHNVPSESILMVMQI
jgi:AdoMet-dependent rRNA methyltransferase SPB1